MSHELRTPLNAVLGFGQLLEMDTLTSEQEEGVHQILKGGRHLLALINEVLDIARIESGHISLSLEAVQVHEAVTEALDLIRPLASDHGVALVVEVPNEMGYVRGDRQRLKQVLLNLLSNGVKYNRSGGTVTLRCSPTVDGGVRLDVADDGPGIGESDMGRLFIPFDRLGAEQTDVEGTGLGLALSKHLVEAMGGSLSAQSAPARGSTFTVELPATVGPEQQYEQMGGLDDAMPIGPEVSGALLYIEDNAANLKLIERVIAGRPAYRLLTAMQGSLGLDLAKQHGPDLILLDLNLPDMPGSEVLRRLQTDPQTKDIPVVVISADATQDRIRKLLASGARAYLTKPLDVRRVLELVDETMKERRLDLAR
jgi:CheY-like chemotaxis protein